MNMHIYRCSCQTLTYHANKAVYTVFIKLIRGECSILNGDVKLNEVFLKILIGIFKVNTTT